MSCCYRYFLAVACCLLVSVAAAKEQEVRAYNSYTYPPFVLPDGSGLAQDLVAALNRELRGRYHLNLENLPRVHLMKRTLADPAGFSGVVLFLNPAFVEDASMSRWLWTDVLYEDRNLLVFRSGEAPALNSLEQLKGLRFGAMLGSHYPGLDEMLAAGELKKDTTTSATLLMRALMLRRVDFLQMNRLSFASMSKQPEFEGKVVAVAVPKQPGFARQILVGRSQAALARELGELWPRLRCDRQWRAQLQRHGIEPPACQAPANPR